jgi:signal transduction histidine kinase
VPAVALHAIALDNLLTGRALRPAPALWKWVLALLAGALAGALAAARPPLLSFFITLLLMTGLAAISLLAYTHNIWLDVTAAWPGVIFAFLAGVIGRARRQERAGANVAATVGALTHVSRVIAVQTQPREILQRVLDYAQSVIPAQSAQVLLFDETDGRLQYAALTGPAREKLLELAPPSENSVAARVARSGEPIVVNEAARDGRSAGRNGRSAGRDGRSAGRDGRSAGRDGRAWSLAEEAGGLAPRSLLCVPLRAGERTLGVLQLVNHAGGAPFTGADVELLQAVAGQAAAALDNSRMYGRLHERVAQSTEELARTNRRLETEKGLLSTVLQSMSDGVAVTDGQGLVQIVNPAASTLLPELSANALGRPLAELLPELATDGAGWNEPSSLQLRRGQGDATRVIAVRTAPLRVIEGGASGLIAVLADVTREEEIQQAKSDFVSFVAHEMRSPLTSIAGFTALLLREQEGAPESAQTPYLGIIRDESDRLTRLINSLLDVARIEAGGGLDLRLEPLDFAPLAREAAALQRGYSERHEIVCEVPDALPLVRADADKAKQILINLLSNAQKHTPRGTVTITARVADEFLEVAVRDHGPGIPPEVRARLFERFAGSARNTRMPSTGLGLFLTRHLVQAHGGRIWVESETGQGAAFLFTLPLAE